MRTRKMIVVPLIIGLIGFTLISRRPRFELMHTVDVLQLLATGMCFGVALMAALGRLRPRDGE